MNIRIFVLSIGIGTATASFAQQKVEVEDVVSVALEKEYNIQLSKNTAAYWDRNAKNAIGVFLPDVTLNANRTWTNNSSKQVLANDTESVRPNVKSDNTGANAQLNWVLFDGLRMFAVYKGAQNIAAANEGLLKNQVANTMADVIGNYYAIVAQKQQLKAINEQVAVGEERIKLADRRLQVGSAAKTELLQARLDQNAFKTAALQQEALIIQSKANLNALTALSLPEQFEVSDTIPLNLDLTIEEIMTGFENTNLQLIALRMNIESAKYTVKANRGSLMPSVSFISNYNFSKQNNAQAVNQFSPLFNQNKGYTYGFTATFPILNNFAARNAFQLAKIDLDRAQLLYNQAKNQAIADIKVAYANYDNARRTLVIEEENIKFAKENVSIMLETFKRGVATFIELRTAQQSSVDAYNRLTTARYNAKVSETELLRLKGALLR